MAPARETAVATAPFLPLLVGFPLVDLAVTYLLGLVWSPSGLRPLGFPPDWDMRHLFLWGTVSRAVGVLVAVPALRWLKRRGASLPLRRACMVGLAVYAIGLAEFLFGLVASGCAFNPQAPWDCTVGD